MANKRISFLRNFNTYKGLVGRDIVRKLLVEIGEKEHDIVLLGADSIISCGGNLFAEKFPYRTFNFGIAEANMISAAGGFAMMHKIPVVGIYGFLLLRCAEQIKNDICYNNRNVKIFTTASGCNLAGGGVTHHATEDISLMRSFANMTIIQPASPIEVILAMYKAILDYEGPVYLRISRNIKEEIYKEGEIEFEIGKAITLKEGKDVTLIASGVPVLVAKKATETLAKIGVDARLINMHTIKPIDKEVIIKAASETEGIIVIEDGNISGGLGASVCKVICEEFPTKVKVIGIPEDNFTIIGDSEKSLWDYFGISEENIFEKVKNILK